MCCDNSVPKHPSMSFPCGHTFHVLCAVRWMGQKGSEGQKATCPMCRTKMTGIEEIRPRGGTQSHDAWSITPAREGLGNRYCGTCQFYKRADCFSTPIIRTCRYCELHQSVVEGFTGVPDGKRRCEQCYFVRDVAAFTHSPFKCDACMVMCAG